MKTGWQDLFYATHKARNAVENYNFLISAGTSHDNAIARVGYTAVEWEKMRDTASKRATRAA